MSKRSSMDFPDTHANPSRSAASGSPRYMYVVDRLSEGILSSVFFGSAKINEAKLQQHLNMRAAQGFRMRFQFIEQKRTLLFGKRESLIITFEKIG